MEYTEGKTTCSYRIAGEQRGGNKKKKQGKTSSAVVQQTATALRSISRILLEATRTP